MIFVDTSAFVSLNDKHNKYHKDAVSWVRSRLSETVGLCTSMQVIAEATGELQKINHEKAIKFLKYFAKPGIQILEDNKEIQDDAWKIFLKLQEQDKVTFWDCWKVATMQYYGVMKIFSFNMNMKNMNIIIFNGDINHGFNN